MTAVGVDPDSRAGLSGNSQPRSRMRVSVGGKLLKWPPRLGVVLLNRPNRTVAKHRSRLLHQRWAMRYLSDQISRVVGISLN